MDQAQHERIKNTTKPNQIWVQHKHYTGLQLKGTTFDLNPDWQIGVLYHFV
jgi:hypothetical protein